MKNAITILIAIILFSPVIAQETKTHSVYFNTASFQPDAAAMQILDSVAAYCKKNNAAVVSLTGYCDSVGTTERNQVLSEKRVDTVKSVLMQKGIQLNGIQKKGKGETLEFAGNEFYKNRRVDIVTTKPEVRKAPIVEKKVSELEEKITQAKPGDLIRLENISFYNNTSRPLPESVPVMEDLYNIMVSQPTLEIAIEGHICCIDNDFTNLSGERAQVVYDYLVRKGIDADRMSYQGFGHTRPLNEEKNEAEKQINRRVEIRVVKK